MISSFTMIDEIVVQSIQHDYITAADHARLVRLVEGPSRIATLFANMWRPLSPSQDSESRRQEAQSLIRPEIQPTA